MFPKGKHDDQVDPTAQMLDWLKRAGSDPSSDTGIWQFDKERAMKRSRPAAAAAVDIIAHFPPVVTTQRSIPEAYRTARRALGQSRLFTFRSQSQQQVIEQRYAITGNQTTDASLARAITTGVGHFNRSLPVLAPPRDATRYPASDAVEIAIIR
jgi:hypothetical protein